MLLDLRRSVFELLAPGKAALAITIADPVENKRSFCWRTQIPDSREITSGSKKAAGGKVNIDQGNLFSQMRRIIKQYVI